MFLTYQLLNKQRLNHRNLLLSRINYHRRFKFTEKISHRLKQVIKRIELQYSVNQIAESLLEPLDIIQPIYDIVLQQESDYDANLILDELNSKNIQ